MSLHSRSYSLEHSHFLSWVCQLPDKPLPEVSTKIDNKLARLRSLSAILEVGAATSWNINGGAATFAPNLAAEITPIEGWLELEAGVSPFYTRKSTEWDTDLLFKKPWTLSRKAEFMLGIGPQWTYLKQNGKTANSIAGEVAGDFMFWPSDKHRFGWFLEPAYDYSFAAGHPQSVGMSAGLLIGIR